jgi:cytoskeletal protein RodZ
LGSFGEKLRKQREQRGIALEAISGTTKISTRMLRALEEENFNQLPGGVFNKGFVRAYARYVGLDEEEAIADYLEALRESQVQSQTILPDFRSPANKPLNAPISDLTQRGPKDRAARLDRPEALGNSENNGGKSPEEIAADRRKKHRRNDDRQNDDRPNDARIHRNQQSEASSQKHLPGDDRAHEEQMHEALITEAQTRDGQRRAGHPSIQMFASDSLREKQSGSSGEPYVRIPWGTLAAALLIISAGLAFWSHHRRAHLNVPSPSQQAASGQTVAPAPASQSLSQSSGNKGSLKGASTSQAPTKQAEANSATARRTSVARTSSSSAPGAASMATSTAPEPASSSNNAPPTPTGASRPTSAETPATFTLLIRAEKTSWVSILADGKPVAEETLIAPAETSVRASEIVVKAGNAAGVSFLFDGKEIPAQGKDGEVRTYTFDSSGMKVSAGQTSIAAP